MRLEYIMSKIGMGRTERVLSSPPPPPHTISLIKFNSDLLIRIIIKYLLARAIHAIHAIHAIRQCTPPYPYTLHENVRYDTP